MLSARYRPPSAFIVLIVFSDNRVLIILIIWANLVVFFVRLRVIYLDCLSISILKDRICILLGVFLLLVYRLLKAAAFNRNSMSV